MADVGGAAAACSCCVNPEIYLVIALAAGGCTPALATPVSTDPATPPIPGGAATTVAAPGRSNVLVEESVGTDRERARAAAARVRNRIDECQLGSAGVVHARVTPDPDGDGVRISLRRGRPLLTAERDCVMAALESVEIDDLGSQASPSNRPLDTYVLLRVEW
jgi:hypothetical protein